MDEYSLCNPAGRWLDKGSWPENTPHQRLMLAVMFNLPKWLLAAAVFCVVIGHLEQMESMFKECCPMAVHAEGSNDAGDSGGHGDCLCLCHFNGPVPFLASEFSTILRVSQEVSFVHLLVHAPEAPCLDVEYPPRSRLA